MMQERAGFKFELFNPKDVDPFDKLFGIFKELITHTSGDFDEAIDWLRELDKEYKLTTPDYTVDDFINDLLERGFIKQEIDPNAGVMEVVMMKTQPVLQSLQRQNNYYASMP